MPTRLFADLPPATALRTPPERAAAFRRAANHLAHQSVSADGAWLHGGKPPEDRQWLWMAGSLLASGDAADQRLAETMIVHAPPSAMATGLDLKPAAPWCIFANNHAITLLHRHGDRLQGAARERLLVWARQALRDHPGDRQADYQFHGYNDNMPAKATCGLILGGEMLADPAAVAHGVWLLRQLRDQFARRGVISEHCSPTYSPLTIAYLGEIAQHAQNAEARVLAAGCAERMWAEILGRYHPNLGLAGGPYSRAYATDSVGQLSQLNTMLWLVFGDEVQPNPLTEFTREPPRLVLHHGGDVFFNLAGSAWLATMDWQPPAHLVTWMRTRGYPHRLVATAERADGCGPHGSSHSAGTILATSWHEPDFALGTSTGDWGATQAEEWFLSWRRRAPVGDAADVRHLFQRLLADDARPGLRMPSGSGEWTGEHDWQGDMARTHTVQSGRSSLVLVSPSSIFAGRGLRKIRFLIGAGEHLVPLDLFELDTRQRCLWIEDGPVRVGVRLLGANGFGAAEPLTVERRDSYALAWLNLWDGPGRAFTADELATTCCGFVSEIGLVGEESRDAFRRRVLAAPLVDYEYYHQRTVRWQGSGGELATSIALRSWGKRFTTINGRQVEETPWSATGLPAARLPFLAGDAAPGAFDLPFTDLAVHFGPQEPWAIYSRAGGPPAGSSR